MCLWWNSQRQLGLEGSDILTGSIIQGFMTNRNSWEVVKGTRGESLEEVNPWGVSLAYTFLYPCPCFILIAKWMVSLSTLFSHCILHNYTVPSGCGLEGHEPKHFFFHSWRGFVGVLLHLHIHSTMVGGFLGLCELRERQKQEYIQRTWPLHG